MARFHRIDFANGDVPPWLNNLVALTRPLSATMVVMIPALGAFSVGLMTWWVDAATGAAMAKNSTDFLKGIPDVAYFTIGSIALGYTTGKTIESLKMKPPPAGPGSPESGPNQANPSLVEEIPAPAVFDTSTLEIPHPEFAKPKPVGTEIME